MTSARRNPDGDIAWVNQIMNTRKYKSRHTNSGWEQVLKNLNIYKEIPKIEWPENETFAIFFQVSFTCILAPGLILRILTGPAWILLASDPRTSG